MSESWEPRYRPDFVMVGTRVNADQVAIIATTSVREAELEYRADTEPVWDPTYLSPIRYAVVDRRYVLTAVFGQYVMVTAPTYAEAFVHLMRQWAPPTEPVAELDGPQRALPPGAHL